jgi:Trypsin-co-occurring domain 1
LHAGRGESMDVSDVTLVKVVDLQDGREIAWGGGATERLHERIADVERAVADGVRTVASGLRDLATPEGWEVGEVQASFGVGLVAEAGVVLTKISGEATFEVTVTFRRTE